MGLPERHLLWFVVPDWPLRLPYSSSCGLQHLLLRPSDQASRAVRPTIQGAMSPTCHFRCSGRGRNVAEPISHVTCGESLPLVLFRFSTAAPSSTIRLDDPFFSRSAMRAPVAALRYSCRMLFLPLVFQWLLVSKAFYSALAQCNGTASFLLILFTTI